MSRFLDHTGARIPLICGAMYPCSNPELVAAVSAAGGLGVVQPISLTHVHGHELREGLRYIRTLSERPVGFNALVEASSKTYLRRMQAWVATALEEGVRFFVTALGNPREIVEAVHAQGGIVYHDVTERRWADKALAAGVDGLICVNERAGGHAGTRSARALLEELEDLDVPKVCAGGIGDEAAFVAALAMGYDACQLGTRFIAAEECKVHEDYKRAIVEADADDIVLTERLSGVPVSVINTPYIQATGTKAGPIARWLLRGRRTKHWVRMYYSLRAVRQLAQASQKGSAYQDYFQAGKSVGGIHGVEPAAAIVARFEDAWQAMDR